MSKFLVHAPSQHALPRSFSYRLASISATLGLCFALCQCNGTIGTLAYRTETREKLLITDIRSTGVECANATGRRGLTLGSRNTTIIQRAPDTSRQGQSSWKYGFAPAISGDPIHISTVARGIELAADSTFSGISVGITGRSASFLPAEDSLSFSLNISPDHPEQTDVKLHSP